MKCRFDELDTNMNEGYNYGADEAAQMAAEDSDSEMTEKQRKSKRARSEGPRAHKPATTRSSAPRAISRPPTRSSSTSDQDSKRMILGRFQKKLDYDTRKKILLTAINGCDLDKAYGGTIKIHYFNPTDFRIALDFNSHQDREDWRRVFIWNLAPSYLDHDGKDSRIYWNTPEPKWKSHRFGLLTIAKAVLVEDMQLTNPAVITLNKGDGSLEIDGFDLLRIRVEDDLTTKFTWCLRKDKEVRLLANHDKEPSRIEALIKSKVRNHA